MKTQKHTPGPWKFGNAHSTYFVYHGNQPHARVARTYTANNADAKLIAAAPELLEALQGLADCLKDSADFKDCPLGKARAAIAKAT